MSGGAAPGIRLDKALWYLRLARTRGAAQALIAAGHIRLNGRRADRASATVREGSLLVLPGPPRVRVLRILRLPQRRGPPAEAAGYYIELGAPEGNGGDSAISAA